MPKMISTRTAPAVELTPEPNTNRFLHDLPAQPVKSDELMAAEAALAALIAECEQYESLRSDAIENADVDSLLRVDARNTVLPSLIDAAEVAVHNARINWLRANFTLFDAPMKEHVDTMTTLMEQRQRLDDEIGLRGHALGELDARREGFRREARVSEVRRDELVAKSPAARRAHARSSA